jgi:NAD(P)-dependent dehydrogenase (short-subunit alcohol dehydrogenase family)
MCKTVLITGAARNLGKTVVNNFLNKEYYIIATDNVGSQIHKLEPHSNLETHEVNAMSEKDANNFVQSSITRHGKIDAA